MSKSVWPVMGVIFLVCVGIAALDVKAHVQLGPITFLAWCVVVSGVAAFVAWAIYQIVAAVRGRGLGA